MRAIRGKKKQETEIGKQKCRTTQKQNSTKAVQHKNRVTQKQNNTKTLTVEPLGVVLRGPESRAGSHNPVDGWIAAGKVHCGGAVIIPVGRH